VWYRPRRDAVLELVLPRNAIQLYKAEYLFINAESANWYGWTVVLVRTTAAIISAVQQQSKKPA
jgi:hypothetical protein